MLTIKKSDCSVTIRKKRGFKPVLWITMVAVLFSVFAPWSGNLFAKAAGSPAEYYQFIEKENLNSKIDSMTKRYADYVNEYQKSLKQQIGTELTMNAVLSPAFAKSAGLEDLKSIKATMTNMSKGDIFKSSMTLFVNDKSLASMETYFNQEGLYYFLIPGLSKAYLKLSMNDLAGANVSSSQRMQKFMEDPISEKEVNTLLKKYAFMAISQVNKVDMTENCELNINGAAVTATKLTVHVDQKTSLTIAKEILSAAKKDTELKKLFAGLGIYTEKQYDEEIKDSLKEVNSDLKALDNKKSTGTDSARMYVWIDGNGKIIGRSFKIMDGKDSSSFGYQTAQKGITMGVKAWVKEGGITTLEAAGSFTKGLSGISGTMTLGFADEYSTTPEAFKISLKDFKYTVKGSNEFINGDINVSGKSLDGISFNVKCAGDFNRQNVIFEVLQENQLMETVTMTVKEVPFKDFNLPSSEKVYDLMTESDQYMLEADFENYLKGIKEKSDVKAIDDYIDTVLSDFVNN